MLKLSEFANIDQHNPTWNRNVWYAGHPGSGRSPATARFDPAINGREHAGTDFACQRSMLYSPHQGRVRYARWQNAGAGHAVTINHGRTLIDVGERFFGEVHEVYSRHLHMSPDAKWQTKEFLVREGEWVEKGQPLGRAGNSGSSAGIHDHCELVVGGPYFPAYMRRNLDTELVYTGFTKGYWGGGDDVEEVVKAIQETLTAAGYDPGPIDGIMGTKTKAAMTARNIDAKNGTGGGSISWETVEVVRTINTGG